MLSLLLLVVGCAPSQSNPPVANVTTPRIDSSSRTVNDGTRLSQREIAVVSTDEFFGFIMPSGTIACALRRSPTGMSSTWRPTASDIARANKRILAFLKENSPSYADRRWECVGQYLGIDTPQGRMIYCNFVLASDITSGDDLDTVLNLEDLMLNYVVETPRGFAITYDPGDDACCDFRAAQED